MQKKPQPALHWRLLLWGGAGMIGQEVMAAAVRAGHQVTILAARGVQPVRPIPPETAWMQADLDQPQTYSNLLTGQDAIIDCAGLLSQGRVNGRKYHRSKLLDLAGRLTAAAKAAGVKKIVLLGSANLFAGADMESATSEDNPLCNRAYGRMYAPIWDELKAIGSDSGITVRVHPGKVYGPGGWFMTRVVEPLKYYGTVEFVGQGSNWISPVYSKDAAQGLLLAVEKGQSGRDYILAGEHIRWQDFLGKVCVYMGVRTSPKPVSFWKTVLLEGRMAAEDQVLSCRVVSDRADKELGWTPAFPTMREGLPKALKDLGVLAWK